MRTQPFVLFWGATAGAVLFLGAAWSTASRAFGQAGSLLDVAVLALALLGLAATSFVAGRIVVVAARAQHRSRNA